jgi:hypothetical protein
MAILYQDLLTQPRATRPSTLHETPTTTSILIRGVFLHFWQLESFSFCLVGITRDYVLRSILTLMDDDGGNGALSPSLVHPIYRLVGVRVRQLAWVSVRYKVSRTSTLTVGYLAGLEQTI